MIAFDALLERLDWMDICLRLDADGYAVLPGLLGADAARGLALHAPSSGASLPAPLEQWRTAFYRRLVVIANRWNETMGADLRYPQELEDFLRSNRQAGQTRAQSYLSRLGVQDHVPLHQRNEGEQVFPMQVVAVLSEPGADFQGGEFVMTEQRPRMQSRPMVLPLALGDAAIIATAQRPFKGSKGYYRVNLKHAVSRVRKGERIGLELTFHDAP